MPAESVEDHDQREAGLDACMAELAAEIDRLWADQHDDELSGDEDGAHDGEPDGDTETPAAMIDAVVEPPSGASQSAVDEAVEAAESKDGRSRETDGNDRLSM